MGADYEEALREFKRQSVPFRSIHVEKTRCSAMQEDAFSQYIKGFGLLTGPTPFTIKHCFPMRMKP